ncbi:MAG: DUF1697 domain-containing protein [Polyangiaceae bacterium]
MAVYAALLRAVNVGGTGKLPMADLRALCERAGFEQVATYIQSGNVVFRTSLTAAKAKSVLEGALAKRMGKAVGVHLRSPKQLRQVLDANPFPKAPTARVMACFVEQQPTAAALAAIVIPGREVIAAGPGVVFVHYPEGQGTSKLKLPFAATGTARNLNTVSKLAELAAAIPSRG